MIGETIEGRPGPPVGIVIFLALGALFTAIAFLANALWVFLLVIPCLLIPLALFLTRPRPLRFVLTETSLEVEEPRESIPFAAIESVAAPARPGDLSKPPPEHFAIAVIHERGTLHLPPRLSVPSEDVFHFLLDQFPPSGSIWVNPEIRDFLEGKILQFGHDKICSYRARNNIGDRAPNSGVAVSLALLVSGFLWLLAGALYQDQADVKKNDLTGVYVCGTMLFLGGAISALICYLVSKQRVGANIKGWKSASLVISPLGIALIQGDIEGEMFWDELLDLKYSRKPANMQMTTQPGLHGIHLVFSGGTTVVIADIYDRPLPIIYHEIRRVWKKG